MRAYILHGAVRCGAGAGLNIEVCGAVRAPALDDGAVRCGPPHWMMVRCGAGAGLFNAGRCGRGPNIL